MAALCAGLVACTPPANDTPTTNPSAASSSTPASPVTSQQGGRTLIEWLLSLGPRAPLPPGEDVPDSQAAYEALTRGQCEEVSDKAESLQIQRHRALYAGMAAACLAAFSGDSALWTDAEEALDAAESLGGHLYCWDRDTLTLLRALVNHHRTRPSIAIHKNTGGGISSCPRITGIEPSHGRPGSRLVIEGENLLGVTKVYFNYAFSIAAPAESDPDGRRVVVDAVPDAGEPGETVLVWVQVSSAANPGAFTDPSTQFTYEHDETSTTPTPPTSTGPSQEQTTPNSPTSTSPGQEPTTPASPQAGS